MSAQTTDFSMRPLMLDDAPRISELISDWDVVRWLSGPPHPYVKADAKAFLATMPDQARSGGRHCAIVVDGEFAGIVGIDFRYQQPNAGHWNLGYWLGRPYWGQGIMTSAATQLTHDFFANSAETKLNSGYFSANETSWAIQKRLGFETSGEGLLFNRPQGKRLPHIETVLMRDRFAAQNKSSRKIEQ